MPSRAELVAGLAYKPGWTFKLAGPMNRCMCVFVAAVDSLEPARRRTTQHQFEIPDEACVDSSTFARWAFDRLLQCEWHEAAEFFQFDGRRPFWPGHQGADPYAPADVQE